MWNFGSFGNFGNWGNRWQLSDFWKNRGGNFGGLWGNTGQPPTDPAPVPESAKPAIDQYEAYDKVCEKILADIPSYDYNTSNLSTALSTGRGNCCTISTYSKIACDLMGFPCDIILGYAGNAIQMDMHLWVRVTLGGKKYWSDITMPQMAREQGQTWGEGQKIFASASDIQKHYSSLFVLGIDGSVQKLNSLDLDSGTSPVLDIAAMITAQIVQSESVACKDQVAQALISIGVM